METSGQDTYHSGSLVELLGQATETHRPPCEQQSVFKNKWNIPAIASRTPARNAGVAVPTRRDGCK